MTTQAPEAPGAPTGTEGTSQDGNTSTTPEPQANGTGSPEPTEPGTTAPAATQAADDTPKVIAAIREDFKAERAKRQQAEQAFAQFKADAERREQERAAAEAERNKKLAIALGVATEDEPPDPAKLAEELQRTQEKHAADLAARDAEIRQRDIRLAVLTAAPALEANGALLMDSLSFLGKAQALDPAAPDFGEKLGELIKSAAETNPSYRLAKPAPPKQPTVPRSGGEHNSSPGGNRQWNDDDVARATPAEVQAAQDAGLLVDMGIAPSKKKRF